MVARLILLIGISLVLTGASTGTAGAQDLITNGLWAGSNFDVSGMAGQRPTTPPVANPNIYAALGDSVAAGYGLPYGTNATTTDKRCGRSPSAYPSHIAAATQKTLIHAACVGAKAGDLFTRQGVSGPNFGPQLKKAFSQGVPGLITITAGANDMYWRTYLQKCYVRTCGTSLDTKTTNALLALLETKYDLAMLTIQYKSGGNPPPVILTGYYNPLSAACSTIEPRFTAAEITWMNSRVQALNDTIQRISNRYAFVRYAPVDFTSHDLCSAAPWVQGPTAKAPFHPTAKGQRAIARAVVNAAQ